MSAEFLAPQEVKFWMHPEFSQVLCFSVPIVPGENGREHERVPQMKALIY